MTGFISTLREAPWLGPRRALAWGWMFAGAAVLACVALMIMTRLGTAPDPIGRPLGTDFSSFWTAGQLALAGDPAAAYRPEAHAAAQHATFSAGEGYASDYYAFFYPPPFLLLCLPLAVLPYGLAVIAWIAATGAGYASVVRSLLPAAWPATMASLAYPAFLLNMGHGQNGALSTALIGAAAIHAERRPYLAGIGLGALCFKPQLALLVLPSLIAARRWRALGSAALTTSLLCLASLLAFGLPAWQGFLASAGFAQTALESGWIGFDKMVSPFAAARLLGCTVPAAWSVQAMFSLLALTTVILAARRRPGAAAETAVLVAAACLATPFLLDYDLALLAVPLAWVAACGARTGWLPWEKLILAATFALPLAARPLATQLVVPVAPLLVTVLLAVVCRRAWRASDAR